MAATEPPVMISVRDTLAVITLNSEEAGNQIEPVLAKAFRDACTSITANPKVRVVVVRSSHSDFCIGGHQLEPETSGLSDARVASELADMSLPVIAALNGVVADQGLELALAADIRIASAGARFSMRQVVAGAFPIDGGTQRLTRIAGPALATEMLLTGRELAADEAYSRGLISEIAIDPHVRAERLARDIAQHGALASAYTKRAVLAAGDMTFEEGAHLEADLSFRLHGEDEREEGLAAFREGRSTHMPGAPARDHEQD